MRQTPHLPYGITQCYLPPTQANPSLPYIWEEGQTSTYYCCNLPGGEANTNLYCLVTEAHVCEQLA